MIIETPLIVDALCLAIYSEDIETEHLCKTIVELYHKSVVDGNAFNDDTGKMYIEIIQDIMDEDINISDDADLSGVLLKFESNTIMKDNPEILAKLQKVVDNREKVSRRRINALKGRVRKHLIVIKGSDNLKKIYRASAKLMSTTDQSKQDNLYLSLIEEARGLVDGYENNAPKVESTINMINMTDPKSIRRGLELFKFKRSNKGYKLGMQNMGKMFGRSEGPVPGHFIGFAACTHHFKTGMLMAFTRWLAMYNVPRPQTDKPVAIVFISLENEIHENMMMWFEEAYYNIFKRSPKGLDDDTIIESITTIFSKKGFELLVYREDGDVFGWEEWRSLHDKLNEKYEIVASVLDYMALMKLPDDVSNEPKKYQLLAGRIKNYASRHAMIVATGLQLNGEAEMLAASQTQNIVTKLTAAHLADSKSIKKELDVLIFLHIETNHLGDRYLTIWLDKLKYDKMPAKKDRYMALAFGEYGLVDDIFDPAPSSIVDIYNIESVSTVKGSAKVDVF